MPLSSSCLPRTTTKPKHTAASATRAPPTASPRVAVAWALPVDKLDPHALEVPALALGLHHADPAHLGRRADVGAPVGLLVDAFDVVHPDGIDVVGDQIDLRPDEVGVGQGLGPR